MAGSTPPVPVSGAFFNPQSRAPTPAYLNGLYAFLHQHPHGKILLKYVSEYDVAWPVWAAAREDIRTLPNAEKYIRALVDWAKGGPSAPVSDARTGVIALPLLLILQIGQYFRYLDENHLSHAEFLQQTGEAGGIQGCCGGEPPALSIALAKDEAQVVENSAVFLRILLGVGAYIEAADDWTSSEPTIFAVRLKYEKQKDELMAKFPGVSEHVPIFLIRLTLIDIRICHYRAQIAQFCRKCSSDCTSVQLRQRERTAG